MQVVKLPPAPGYNDIQTILEHALKNAEGMTGVVVIGFDHEGNQFLNTAKVTRRDILWLAESLRHFAVNGTEEFQRQC